MKLPELSKKDKRYIAASVALLLIAVGSVTVFAVQEVYMSKHGIRKTIAKTDQILAEEEGTEILEMERLNSFGQEIREEVVVIDTKGDAEQAMREMDQIMGTIQKGLPSYSETEQKRTPQQGTKADGQPQQTPPDQTQQ